MSLSSGSSYCACSDRLSSTIPDRLSLDVVKSLLDERDAAWQKKFDNEVTSLRTEFETKHATTADLVRVVVQRSTNGPPSPVLTKDPRSTFKPLPPHSSSVPAPSDDQLVEQITNIVKSQVERLDVRIDDTNNLVDDARGKLNMMKGQHLPKLLTRLDRHDEQIKDAAFKGSEVDQKVANLDRSLQEVKPVLERLHAVELGVKSRHEDSKREQLKVCSSCVLWRFSDHVI